MEDTTEYLRPINVTHKNDNLLDVSFHNIQCKVRCCKTKQEKLILRDVSGKFTSGRLSAILGPSGAGKTTLLNILAGYKTRGVRGKVLINGKNRDIQEFRWQSSCISQEAAVLPLLTASETLNIAAELKLSDKISKQQKLKVLSDIVDLLNLQKSLDTRVCQLSGGEVKRLSIGVELLTNPPIMFFDEPTSGLDSVSSNQIISYLRTIASGGRTVVCVIHQPSSKLFDMFDDLLVLANGKTIYGGPISDMISVFESAGFKCPQYYNRADFALEVASFEIEGDVDSLAAKTQYPIPENSSRSSSAILDLEEGTSEEGCDEKFLQQNNGILSNLDEKTDVRIPLEKYDDINSYKRSGEYAVSQWKQFLILLKRSSKCTYRDKHLAQIRVIIQPIIGLILGVVYFNIGDDAAKVQSNTAFLYFILMFIFFSNAMPTVMIFRQEAEVFERESLNNWYSLPAYFFSKILADLPLELLCPTLFLVVGYYMTGQPGDTWRFGMVWVLCVIFTIISQAAGLVSGVVFETQMALFMLPTLTIPMLIFSGFFIRFNELPSYLSCISYVSYFGYAFEAIIQTIYGYDRQKLFCSVPYCYFKDPNQFLKEFGIRFSYTTDLLLLMGFLTFMYISLYAVLKFRVWKSRW